MYFNKGYQQRGVLIKQTTGLFFFTGSHQAFSDVASFFDCAASECVFCKQKNHLQKTHLKDAIFFGDNDQGMLYSFNII